MSSQKLKIALCLSGQPRFYTGDSFESLKREIIDKYDTDVFIHSWISTKKEFEYEFAPWSTIKEKIIIPETCTSDLINLYSPKGFLINEPIVFKKFLKKDTFLYRNMPSMFYSVMKSDDLRKEYEKIYDFKYDFVIRARTDTIIKGELPNLYDLNKSAVYIPDNCGSQQYLNDNFSICGGDISQNIYNLFNDMDNLIEENDIPEIIWTVHLWSNKINVIKIKTEMDFRRS